MIQPEELKSVLYSYQVNQITDNDTEIVEEAIDTAEMLVRGYLNAANLRRETASLTKQQYRAWRLYDIDAMFNKTGTDRNPLLLRIIKRLAAYNIIELSCPDVLTERITAIYNDTIDLLKRIAGEGEFALSRYIIPDAIFQPSDGEGEGEGEGTAADDTLSMPFRMVSRPKFRHEPL
jgi:hypothetical protein